jgi:hypothetical protein
MIINREKRLINYYFVEKLLQASLFFFGMGSSTPGFCSLAETRGCTRKWCKLSLSMPHVALPGYGMIFNHLQKRI